MSRVFVVQDPQEKNILPAQAYGELKILLPAGNVVFSIAPTIAVLRQGMRGITSDDFILAIGDPIAIGIASAIACENCGGLVKFLKWDRQERLYIPVEAAIY